jgi:hypothetical protein
MDIRAVILRRISAHLRRTGLSEAAFGKIVAGNHAWLPRVREGRATLASIERALAEADTSRRKGATRSIADEVTR